MPATLPQDLLLAFSQFVELRIGLHIPQGRLLDLERGVRSAAREMGWPDAEAFTRRLLDAPMSQDVEDLLAAHLTIGETYFYRDPRAFEVLEKEVLPALVQNGAGKDRTLRIWSAACCTGEEPYSIAMAVRRTLGEHSRWKVKILATDLNPRFLRRASQGIYGRWSFRTLTEEVRERFFHKHSEDRWIVDDRIKRDVTFTTLNFVDDPFPSPSNDTQALDVIFCRNVLMYFSRVTAAKVIAKLRQCLVEGGWLFTSATDAPRDLFAGFSTHDAEGTVIYRRSAEEARVPKAARVLLDSSLQGPSQAAKANSRPAGQAPKVPAPSPTPVSPSPFQRNESVDAARDYRRDARNLADEGRFNEALAAIDRAIESDKLDAFAHYLRGVILHEQNLEGEATVSLHRALYLDPGFALAHVTLGNLMRRSGKEKAARRFFENARDILARHDRDHVLPESGGMTAGRLLHMISAPQETAA